MAPGAGGDIRAVEVVEVDVDQLTDVDRRALIAFEQVMWVEHAPGEPSMAEKPTLWLATLRRPNAKRMMWVVRGEADNEMAGVATLSVPLVDNQHLGSVEVHASRPRIAGNASPLRSWPRLRRGRTPSADGCLLAPPGTS